MVIVSVHTGWYAYTKDLQEMDGCRPQPGSVTLTWQNWNQCLAAHPDQVFRRYIVDGIRSGIRVAFVYLHACRRSSWNMALARAIYNNEYKRAINDNKHYLSRKQNFQSLKSLEQHLIIVS